MIGIRKFLKSLAKLRLFIENHAPKEKKKNAVLLKPMIENHKSKHHKVPRTTIPIILSLLIYQNIKGENRTATIKSRINQN